MKLNLKVLEDACNVSAMLAKENAERAFSALQMDAPEECQLNTIVDGLTSKAHFDARQTGFTDRAKGRIHRPTQYYDADTPIDWDTSAIGVKRSAEFSEGVDNLSDFVIHHLPDAPKGRLEKILQDIQSRVLDVVRIVEQQGYDKGYSTVTA